MCNLFCTVQLGCADVAGGIMPSRHKATTMYRGCLCIERVWHCRVKGEVRRLPFGATLLRESGFPMKKCTGVWRDSSALRSLGCSLDTPSPREAFKGALRFEQKFRVW